MDVFVEDANDQNRSSKEKGFLNTRRNQSGESLSTPSNIALPVISDLAIALYMSNSREGLG